MATIAPEVSILACDEAFELLYRRYVKDVYQYALALLRNPADAEDVTQTTFMNAYRAFRRGDQIEKPQNWLIKIAHNVARTRYARSTRRVKEVPLEDHLDQLAVPEEERPNVEGVLRALGCLPFNQRAALVMRELEGRPYSEIADTLGVSVAAVETLIFRARRSLRVRTSALRSLGAVPLPGSLTQLFGGGGTVAGGGALVGGGFVVKATVALVVGAVATGLAGVERQRTDAAPRIAGAANVQALPPPQTAVSRVTARAPTLRVAASHAHRRFETPLAVTLVAADGSVARGPLPDSGRTGATSDSASTPAPTVSISTAPTVPAPVDQVAATVETTVSSATNALPVPLPTVPSLPLQPPPLPTLP